MLPKMWTAERMLWQGTCFSMPERAVLPKPVQKPHPPLWVTVTRLAREPGAGPGPTGGQPEQFELDLAMELDAVERYNQAIVPCTQKNAAGTRELLEHLLKGEEDSVDWHEAQLGLIRTIGAERYLAEQTKE